MNRNKGSHHTSNAASAPPVSRRDRALSNLSRRAFLATACTAGAAAFISATPLTALADPTSADVQAQADAAAAQLNSMQDQLNVASSNYYQALDAHDAAVASMDDAQTRMDSAEAQAQVLENHLSTRAVSMYKNGASTFLDVLFGASSFTEFTSNWDFLQNMNTSDAESIQELAEVKKEATQARDDYAAQEQVAADKLAEAEAVRNDAESLVAQYQAAYGALSAEVAALVSAEQEAQRAASSPSVGGGSSVDYGPAPSYDDSRANSVISVAWSFLGTPYVWGGSDPSGFDCSGFTWYCYLHGAGIDIGRDTGAQFASGTAIPLGSAMPGDVLIRTYGDGGGHAAIYLGNESYIHSPQSGDVVKVSYGWSDFECALRW